MPNKKTICLNMIVKDEVHVIERCLASVKHLIDYWVIVDTGSKDGTQDVIKSFLKDIPGELHERQWVNFAHARNQALELARGKADYFMVIDADDHLVFSKDFSLPVLDKEAYYVFQTDGKLQMMNQALFLFKDLPEFKWICAVHEVLSFPRAVQTSFIQGVYNNYIHDGARSKDPKRYEKDVQMLRKEIETEPNNTRSVFYLAQTYRGGNDYKSAFFYYKKRTQMGEREDEVFCSLYYAGLLAKCLGRPSTEYLLDLHKAYILRQSRAEPVFQMAQHYLEKKEQWLAFLLASFAMTIPLPNEELFVEPWIYDWGILLNYAIASKALGYAEQAKKAKAKLLSNPHFPRTYYPYVA